MITVRTIVDAPIDLVWDAYTAAEDIEKWNSASDDWHTTKASIDLQEGGAFCYRMEAKDRSEGFDFEGTFTRIVEGQLLEYTFGGRQAVVKFSEQGGRVEVQVSFEAEDSFSEEQQRAGWQAILENFSRHVHSKL